MAVNRYGPFVAHDLTTHLPTAGSAQLFAFPDTGFTSPLSGVQLGESTSTFVAQASGYVPPIEVPVAGAVTAGAPVWWKSGSSPALLLHEQSAIAEALMGRLSEQALNTRMGREVPFYYDSTSGWPSRPVTGPGQVAKACSYSRADAPDPWDFLLDGDLWWFASGGGPAAT